MRESIFLASIRSFFLAFFGIIGFIIGIVVILIIIGALSETTDGQPEINYTYTPEIKPNASGIRKSLSSDAPVILKLNIDGIIGTELLNSKTIRQKLIESGERSLKNRVKAILLFIDSPGGSAIDSDAIYRLIKDYKETHKIPVYAYVNGLCASGGMYIASSADKIFASDVSLIGSVGVILSTAVNVSQLMDKLGIQSLTLYDGKGKDNLNPFRPWRKGEEDNIKEAINALYNRFVDVVAENRPNLDKTKLVEDYGADVFPAAKAKELGYIDDNGYDLNRTLKELAEKIGITDEYYQVIALESKNWLTQLFTSENQLLKGKITHRLELTPEMQVGLKDPYMYLYRP